MVHKVPSMSLPVQVKSASFSIRAFVNFEYYYWLVSQPVSDSPIFHFIDRFEMQIPQS